MVTLISKEKFGRPVQGSRWAARRGRIVRNWPVLVWGLVVVLVAWMYSNRAGFAGMRGVVETIPEVVAPLETARLLSIEVRLGQRVKAGDVVARMDTSLLDARLAIEEARLLESESTIASYQQTMLQLADRIEEEIKEADRALRSAKTDQQRDPVKLDDLKKRLQEVETGADDGERTSDRLRAEIAALNQQIGRYPTQLKTLERRLESANREREELKKMLRMREGESISSAIRGEMQSRGTLLASTKERHGHQRRTYILTATRDSVVSRIFHEPGDVVRASEPVLRLVAEHSDRIIGFLPEVHVSDLVLGQKMLVRRQSGQGRELSAGIVSIAPEVQALPGNITPIRDVPLRGRRVLLKLEGTHDLIPGEAVNIRRARAASRSKVSAVPDEDGG